MTNNFTGSDAAIRNVNDDKYGYSYIAEGLADSVINVNDIDGLVIGIEGQWGSGKTSLLNLLINNINSRKISKLHTLKVSPWMGGDTLSIVASLLIPVASIINEIELSQKSHINQLSEKGIEAVSNTGKELFKYIQKTSGAASTFLEIASMAIPGMGIASKIVEGIGRLPSIENGLTIDEEKEKISRKIKELGLRFIVMIDDLDRLEPKQAVEVVRLVKSVANFSHFTYVLCYDKKILSHAVEKGLEVKDGSRFLQKIIQVAFTIPLPEVFDLRNDLKGKLIELYLKNNNNQDMKNEMLDDFNQIIDKYGEKLTTPREVKSVSNALEFHYHHISKNIYYPDICFLFLIKTTNPALYDWIENYLRNRSVLVTRHAHIAEEERKNIGSLLKALLPDERFSSNNSPYYISDIIPGISNTKEPERAVFSQVEEDKENKLLAQQRLCSTAHYRFYFAFAAPKNVLSEERIKHLLNLAENDIFKLKIELLKMVSAPSISGRTWFEYIIDRINKGFVSELNKKQIMGLLTFFFDYADEVYYEFSKRRNLLGMNDLNINEKVNILFHELKKHTEYYEFASKIIIQGKAKNWIVGAYFRECLWDHGIVGNRPSYSENKIFQQDEIIELRQKLIEKTANTTLDNLLELHFPSAFLYGWADITGYDKAKEWINIACKNDEEMLDVLLILRSTTIGDRIYYPLHKNSITNFFDFQEVEERLKEINTEKAEKVKSAMEESRYF